MVCEAHQMAFCIIRNGIPYPRCIDPKRYLDDVALVNWALSLIKEQTRSQTQSISHEDFQILRSGEYSEGTRYQVTFSLPMSIKTAINNINENRGGRIR